MDICVVIPIYRPLVELHVYERISLEQCIRTLHNYAICLIGPSNLNYETYKQFFEARKVNVHVRLFPEAYFKDVSGYSRLLLSPRFYKKFSEFTYMLICQTDAFVFKDELNHWCSRGYDYIGAPWFDNFTDVEDEGIFIGVGNGGFSLRKISSHLKVINTFSYLTSFKENVELRFKEDTGNGFKIKSIGGLILDHTIRNNTHWLLNNFRGNEDLFWGLAATKAFDWFKVPSYIEAASFAFEMQPRRLFQLNNEHLPFGCHAWWKYDLNFWRPHIEKFGYHLSQTN